MLPRYARITERTHGEQTAKRTRSLHGEEKEAPRRRLDRDRSISWSGQSALERDWSARMRMVKHMCAHAQNEREMGSPVRRARMLYARIRARTVVAALTSAPSRTSSETTAVWPLKAALMSTVVPLCGIHLPLRQGSARERPSNLVGVVDVRSAGDQLRNLGGVSAVRCAPELRARDALSDRRAQSRGAVTSKRARKCNVANCFGWQSPALRLACACARRSLRAIRTGATPPSMPAAAALRAARTRSSTLL